MLEMCEENIGMLCLYMMGSKSFCWKIPQIQSDNNPCLGGHCCCKDVSVFGVIRHRINERLVPGDEGAWKGASHRIDK